MPVGKDLWKHGSFSYHCIQSFYCSYCRPLTILTVIVIKSLNVAI
nr:MAG TPA: Putative zinc ribbon domain [Caudoviricetes sp.]